MATKTKKKAPAKSARPAKKAPAKRAPEPEYDNDMRGVLFPNAKKTKDSQPDYKGSAEIEGVEYWISGWANKSKQGRKYISLVFEPKVEPDEPEVDDDDDDDDDDLPF